MKTQSLLFLTVTISLCVACGQIMYEEPKEETKSEPIQVKFRKDSGKDVAVLATCLEPCKVLVELCQANLDKCVEMCQTSEADRQAVNTCANVGSCEYYCEGVK